MGVVMAKQRKVTRHPASGAPGIKPGMGGPALSPTTYQGGGRNFLDVNVAAAEYRANHPMLRFVGRALTPLPPL